MVDACPDTITATFNEVFDGTKVMRLIPFCLVPFQEPGVELIAEQIVAWDHIQALRRQRDKKD
jgi:hypothetical protein